MEGRSEKLIKQIYRKPDLAVIRNSKQWVFVLQDKTITAYRNIKEPWTWTKKSILEGFYS